MITTLTSSFLIFSKLEFFKIPSKFPVTSSNFYTLPQCYPNDKIQAFKETEKEREKMYQQNHRNTTMKGEKKKKEKISSVA